MVLLSRYRDAIYTLARPQFRDGEVPVKLLKFGVVLCLSWLLSGCTAWLTETAPTPAPAVTAPSPQTDATAGDSLDTTAPMFPETEPGSAPIWVMVDTKAATLTIYQGKAVREAFTDISVGRGGVGRKQKRGDMLTPVGDFRIAWINWKSPFHIFFGINYPNIEYAESAIEQRLIDEQTYQDIRRAILARRQPPQNTVLGGNIGIHGIGHGDPGVHESFNWTQGCIALTNRDVERMAHWVDVGTRVVIR
jgi:hypothetical protein